MRVREMISTHPDVQGSTADKLLKSIEKCDSCAQTCTACAEACLAESTVDQLRQCIRLNLDCADICMATGAMASRRTGSNVEVLRAAIQACSEAFADAVKSAKAMPRSTSTAGFARRVMHALR
ncbi:four-helix bundle copper-binding protein [Chelativorans intermedius]|uniref:Four-helix bundle copper-binding protein n=1 Tax=Chelativorans intermedius TaxID=515947 RepID=A0ABV6DBM6_9HYPH|nr:four-helix bundle copper-binding protein [Chelativorans intermedius]